MSQSHRCCDTVKAERVAATNGGRRQLRTRRASRHSELVFKHELYQLRQYAVLGAKNVLELAERHTGLFVDFRQRGLLVALFQKQLHANGQNPLLRGQTCACDGYEDHFLSAVV